VNRRQAILTLSLLAATPISFWLTLSLGSLTTDTGALWSVLQGEDRGILSTVVVELRLPRALSAFAVGGLLALSGSLLQVLLRNPLADPYILGISGGAALGALGSLLLGLTGWWLNGSAFIGSLLAMLLVFGLVRHQGVTQPARLLLTGVVVAAGWGALISLILALSPQRQLPGMLYWLMGDLSYGKQPMAGLIVLAIGTGIAWWLARPLNILARGEQVTASLGINPLRLHIMVYILASLATASAVSLAGSIGFVGLVIPHALRLLGATDHRILLPNAVLLGGNFLMLADTAARTVVAPLQLPVGVLTALLGVPVFLYLLLREHRI